MKGDKIIEEMQTRTNLSDKHIFIIREKSKALEVVVAKQTRNKTRDKFTYFYKEWKKKFLIFKNVDVCILKFPKIQ